MTTIPVRKILATLGPDEDAKGIVMRCLKNKGVSLDEFPRTRLSVETMAEALTRAEDALELQRGSGAAALRAQIRPLRRALEGSIE